MTQPRLIRVLLWVIVYGHWHREMLPLPMGVTNLKQPVGHDLLLSPNKGSTSVRGRMWPTNRDKHRDKSRPKIILVSEVPEARPTPSHSGCCCCAVIQVNHPPKIVKRTQKEFLKILSKQYSLSKLHPNILSHAIKSFHYSASPMGWTFF